jgi:hypothetical protein
MTGARVPARHGVIALGWPPNVATQDARTVRLLRLGVGVIGTVLPLALIAGNWITGGKVIVPASMSGSYYTSTRNLFVGALCALGVFLIGYRHTRRQNRCTWFAGVCALLVAFDPTAPPRPQTEPAWINYLHHTAAGALLFTLGLFCWIVFADHANAGTVPPRSMADRVRSWVTRAWDILKRGGRSCLYLGCGLLVFISGALALYTGLWPTSWSAGWQSCYLFEAVAVFAFGIAWLTAGLQGASATTWERGNSSRAATTTHPALAGRTA